MNNDVTYTKALVKAAMQSVVDWWFTLYPNSVFLISETGDVSSGTNTIGYQNIRAVQNEIVAENEKVYMAFTGEKIINSNSCFFILIIFVFYKYKK